MTLTEYISAEFGIVPDEVQLEHIREIVVKEYAKREIKKGYLPEVKEDNERYLSKLKTEWFYMPYMGFFFD